MRGEGNLLINNVNVGMEFHPIYKNVLSDNRRSLTFENLRKLVVVYCKNSE
jgi:hypothetical protein